MEQSSIRCKYSKTCCFISSEANLRVAEKETPIVLSRNLVQLTLHMLTVFPLIIENCVDGTTRWPLKWRDTHLAG